MAGAWRRGWNWRLRSEVLNQVSGREVGQGEREAERQHGREGTEGGGREDTRGMGERRREERMREGRIRLKS